MEERGKLTEAELKAAAARFDEIYASAYEIIEARQKAEAELARLKEPFVKPKAKPRTEITTSAIDAAFANVVEFPPKLSEQELMRRQAIIDQHWQAMLDEKELLRKEAEARSFHKAPGDPDWDLGA